MTLQQHATPSLSPRPWPAAPTCAPPTALVCAPALLRACAPARLCLCVCARARVHAWARAHACLTSLEIAAAEYIKRFLCNMLTARENRNIGCPWSPEGVKRALSSVGGTVAAAHAVCGGPYLFSGHVAGGTHHAFYDYGEGFCVFSDIAVAANTMMRDYPHVQRILIVDLDVHQGVRVCAKVSVNVRGREGERDSECEYERARGRERP